MLKRIVIGACLALAPVAHAQEVEMADEEWAESIDEADVELLREEIAEVAEVPELQLPESEREPVVLPSGEAKSAVTPQSVSLPTGGGSIEGMGESFEAALQSGAATFGVPLAVPPGRNGVQPSLSLAYSSTNGNGVAGIGWGVGVGAIHRQSDRGLPRYVDGPSWHSEEDRFVFGAGQELVPVDNAAAMLIDCGAPDCAPVPVELAGWQQYRAKNEGGFNRIFRSPDGTRWVVQAPDGSRSDFGQLPPGDGPPEVVAASVDAVVSELPGGGGRVFGWKLTRTVDPNGSVVYYRYFRDGGVSYLQDIHYGSPHAACSAGDVAARMRCSAPLSDYGQRVRFVYETRQDVTTSFATTWGMTTALRVKRIEMTAAAMSVGTRYLVRRYHLGYSSAHHHSLLESVTVEGRPQELVPTLGVQVGDPLVPESSLGESLVGATAPPMTFEYTEAPSGIAEGFGGVASVVQSAAMSPPHSVDEGRSDLFDVNSDGLPDLIVTDPARYRTSDGSPAVGVFFNGFTGPGAAPADAAATFSGAVPMGMPSDLSATLSLSNSNIQPMDVDGDGRSDLLHFPRTPDTGYFVAARNGDAAAASPAAQGWQWVYVPSDLPEGVVDPRIDFQRDRERLRMLDVNNDHLVDVVRTAGDRIQIWLNLGWLPEGDGRFGSYANVAGTWQLSDDPIERCLPSAGTPVDFADSETRFADMNGDGVQDLVRVRRGRVIYWPGRGERGFGDFGSCGSGIVSGGYVEMASPPAELHVDGAGVHLSDVNGDGVTDVLQVDSRDIHVWFNRSGSSFARRVTARTGLFAPAFAPRVRLADLDGSGTLDVVFGNANDWKFIDLMNGQRPRMLSRVTTGLGGRTDITYGTSAEDYLADLREAHSCPECESFTWTTFPESCDQKLLAEADQCVYRAGGSPVVVQVVREVRSSDRLDVVGGDATVVVTQHAYHDAYYEGFEQEHRGFGAADAIAVGGAGHPTAFVRSHFHQGRRSAAIASDRLADNRDEPLAGLTYLSEAFDEAGEYVSTSHSSFAVRTLHQGLDGRVVRFAHGVQSDELVYDVTNWAPGTESVIVPTVRHEDESGTTVDAWNDASLVVRGAGWAHTRSTTNVVTNVGHTLRATAHGRIRGAFGETVSDESIVSEREIENLGSWLFRETRTFTHGHGDPTPLGDTTTTHDARGNAIATATAVSQAQLYEFAGDGEALSFPMAPPEPLVGTVEVDAWGQTLRSCSGGDVATGAGCLTYAELEYDGDYAQLPMAESTAVGRDGVSFSVLTSTGTWDRGLGIATSMTDPNGITGSVAVDGFGRTTAQIPPPATGCPAGRPSTRVVYEHAEPSTRPLSRVHTWTETSCTGALGEGALESIAVIDGVGRARATLTTGDAPGEWIRSGITELTARGTVRRAYQPIEYTGDPDALAAVLAIPSVPSTAAAYDAFGRQTASWAEDGSLTMTHYHALSTDVCDPLDHPGERFAGTCTTERVDGHGRTVDRILRNQDPDVPGSSSVYRLWMRYRADGSLVHLQRAETTGDHPMGSSTLVGDHHVERFFDYDSVGRRVASTDPDTDSPGKDATQRSWRYLFNRVGDLVAVRDPRGCGQNFFYDHGGRLVGEQYVSCSEAQAHELPVDDVPAGLIALDETTVTQPVDVRHYFDSYAGTWAPDPSLLEDFPATTSGVLGRLTASVDRAVRMVTAYDARGQAVWSARQLAVVPAAPAIATSLSTPSVETSDGAGGSAFFDEDHTYVVSTSYDHAGRGTAIVLPRDPSSGTRVAGTMAFDHRGLPTSADAHVVDGGGAPAFTDGVMTIPGASIATQPVVSAIAYLRDGLVASTTYGDGTVTQSTYDSRRRPTRMWTTRTPTASSDASAPLGAVTVVADQELVWDEASNLLQVDDDRIAAEWPAGHRPQSVWAKHDALYRVVGVEMDYGGALDAATDWRSGMAATYANDPMRTDPAPMLSAAPADRVMSLTYDVDWLGNVRDWTDDAHQFYERSLGAISNGADTDSSLRPSALYLASDLGGSPSARGGWVEMDYGESGNLVMMTVHASCADGAGTCVDPGGDLDARRDALEAACTCAEEQHYQYRWDELNRLAEARRYDRASGAGSWQLEARQRYRYDQSNQRRVKQTLDTAGDRIALTVIPGDMERRGVVRGATGYEDDPGYESETQYLVAGARMVWKSGTPTPGVDRNHRITVNVSDLIGTTSAVIDLVSGELLEHGTYYPNGARETYRSSGAVAPEPTGFTGKEGDEEVGLTYFGERYLVPRLGRWASPDPLAIHEAGGGEALNSYHYVGGNLLQGRDPLGLDEVDAAAEAEVASTKQRVQSIVDDLGPKYQRSPGSPQGTKCHKCAQVNLDALANPRIITEAVIGPNGRLVAFGDAGGPGAVRRLGHDPNILSVLEADPATAEYVRTKPNGRKAAVKGTFRTVDVLVVNASVAAEDVQNVRQQWAELDGRVDPQDIKFGGARNKGQTELARRIGRGADAVRPSSASSESSFRATGTPGPPRLSESANVHDIPRSGSGGGLGRAASAGGTVLGVWFALTSGDPEEALQGMALEEAATLASGTLGLFVGAAITILSSPPPISREMTQMHVEGGGPCGGEDDGCN